MIKRKYITKAATEGGFYWLKNVLGTEFPAQYHGDGCWSTVNHHFSKWSWLLQDGHKRSIRELKP